MPLHPDPTNVAEGLARHLELNYALQLDPYRHKALVAELAAFGEMFLAEALDEPEPLVVNQPAPPVMTNSQEISKALNDELLRILKKGTPAEVPDAK